MYSKLAGSALDIGMIAWLTGLPSSGKTTISGAVRRRLTIDGYRVEVLDGDECRSHLAKELGFSREDREENVRRISYVADLLARNGVIVLVSAISPYRAIREELRQKLPRFLEIYVNAPLEVCERRDVKGLYRKARRGEIHHLTGVDDVYEAPVYPDLECHTDVETVQQSADKVTAFILRSIRELTLHVAAR